MCQEVFFYKAKAHLKIWRCVVGLNEPNKVTTL